MEEFAIKISEKARLRRKEIYEYISGNLQSAKAAANTIKNIDAAIQKLNILPDIYLKIKISDKVVIRCLRVNNFNIFYKIDEDNKIVYIVTIQYCKRSIDSIFKDLD